MAVVKVLFPQLSMGMKDGEIVRWHKAVGDMVKSGETIAEIEAAKAAAELPSPADGRLIEILCEEGEVIQVRTPIAKIEVG